jgi:spore cortex formation protein SpoVR/YcgB (stage V sporulation)
MPSEWEVKAEGRQGDAPFFEARRWFTTAEDDLDTAKILKENAKYAHSCFHTQQAGEKAVKSIWYSIDADCQCVLRVLFQNVADIIVPGIRGIPTESCCC